MSIYCAAVECKYNGNRNRCTAKKVTLSSHSVMTVWQGRQEYLKCKSFELSEESKRIQELLESVAEK